MGRHSTQVSAEHLHSCSLYMSAHRDLTAKQREAVLTGYSGWLHLPIFICQVSGDICTFVKYPSLYVHAYVCICASVHVWQFSDIRYNTDYSHRADYIPEYRKLHSLTLIFSHPPTPGNGHCTFQFCAFDHWIPYTRCLL